MTLLELTYTRAVFHKTRIHTGDIVRLYMTLHIRLRLKMHGVCCMYMSCTQSMSPVALKFVLEQQLLVHGNNIYAISQGSVRYVRRCETSCTTHAVLSIQQRTH